MTHHKCKKLHSNKLSEEHKHNIKKMTSLCCITAILLEFVKVSPPKITYTHFICSFNMLYIKVFVAE